MGLAIIVPNVSFDDVNLGKVTLSGNVPIKGLYINLNNYYAGTRIKLRASFLPANTTERDVTWNIESGSEYASISGSFLNILDGANENDVTIKCTSTYNSSIYAEKTIKVSYLEEETLVITDFTSYSQHKAAININDGTWLTKYEHYGIFVPVGPYNSVEIYPQDGKSASIFELSNNDTPVNRYAVPIVGAWAAGSNQHYSTEIQKFSFDTECKYLWIVVSIQGDNVTALPSKIILKL